ncbi:MAG: hypothetical protein F6K21_10720 [Symploca sp. SIO2D2]|nr:hypothetical protein [Symploca sp. SIO2D2]
MKRIALLLVATVLAFTTSFLGLVGTASAATEYNLLMPNERPGAPYSQLNNYNTSLTATGSGSGYPVEVMRHHIVPDSKLKEFWNKMVNNDHLVTAADGLLKVIHDTVDQYQMTLNTADRNTVKLLTDKIRNKEYQHNPNRPSPEGFDNLAQVYEWLPGNLFIGPKGGNGQYQRSDDPGNNFEKNSDVIVGSSAYNDLKNACLSIKAYLLPTGQVANARTASMNLSNVAKKTKLYDLKKDNWLFINQRYKINAPDKQNPCDLS